VGGTVGYDLGGCEVEGKVEEGGGYQFSFYAQAINQVFAAELCLAHLLALSGGEKWRAE
jgi:hypothetical protein